MGGVSVAKLSPLVLGSRLSHQGPPASLPRGLSFFSPWDWLSCVGLRPNYSVKGRVAFNGVNPSPFFPYSLGTSHSAHSAGSVR